MKKTVTFILLGLIIWIGVSFWQDYLKSSSLSALAPSVTKFSRSLEAIVNENYVATLTIDYLAILKSEKPDLVKQFDKTSIKYKHSKDQVILLIGTGDGKKALFEDDSWSPILDKNHIDSGIDTGFEFSLELSEK